MSVGYCPECERPLSEPEPPRCPQCKFPLDNEAPFYCKEIRRHGDRDYYIDCPACQSELRVAPISVNDTETFRVYPSPALESEGWVDEYAHLAIHVNGGEIMYRQGGTRAEMWRLKSVPPVAFNQERPNLTEGGLDVQGGYLPPCSQGLFRRRDERPRGGPSVRATPGHGAQDARVLRAPRVSTATTGSQTEARSI